MDSFWDSIFARYITFFLFWHLLVFLCACFSSSILPPRPSRRKDCDDVTGRDECGIPRSKAPTTLYVIHTKREEKTQVVVFAFWHTDILISETNDICRRKDVVWCQPGGLDVSHGVGWRPCMWRAAGGCIKLEPLIHTWRCESLRLAVIPRASGSSLWWICGLVLIVRWVDGFVVS